MLRDMVLERNRIRSEEGRMLYDKHFGFLTGQKLPGQKPEQPGVNGTATSHHADATILRQDSSPYDDSPDLGYSAEERPLRRIRTKKHVLQHTTAAKNNPSSPTLHDVINYFKHKGVVGEENLAVAMTLATISRKSFGVEGYSGSGKTFITDKLIELVQDKVYRIGLSSAQAIFHDAARINGRQIIYIPELQKAMKERNSPIIEVIKDLTEGKDASRVVTQKSGRGTIRFTINKGVSIIYTLALENEYKKDEESSRRFIRLRTDSSIEHLNEIHQDKARKRFSLEPSEQAKASLERKLAQHIDSCMSLNGLKVVDPFSEYFSQLVPRTQKSIGYIDHYYALLDASAKFHQPQRVTASLDGQSYLLISLEDHYTVFNAYFKEFFRTLQEFAQRKDAADAEAAESKMFESLPIPDWAECFNSGLALLTYDPALEPFRAAFPSLIDEWHARQVEQQQLMVLDYRTGKKNPVGVIDHAPSPMA